jgi:hypothetical protein
VARYWCERCKAESNTLDPPHLCKDIAARLKRRERQADAVERELLGKVLDGIDNRALAQRLVESMARTGVTDE